MHCSLARSLEVFGDWWSPLILRDLYLGIDRFDALVTDLGLSRNVLSDRLRTLQEGGLVERLSYRERPVRHRYVLTQAGNELIPILMAITVWGDKWLAMRSGAPMVFRHESCGNDLHPVICCPACDEPIDSADVGVYPGPGGKTAPGTMLVAEALSRRGGRTTSH